VFPAGLDALAASLDAGYARGEQPSKVSTLGG